MHILLISVPEVRNNIISIKMTFSSLTLAKDEDFGDSRLDVSVSDKRFVRVTTNTYKKMVVLTSISSCSRKKMTRASFIYNRE